MCAGSRAACGHGQRNALAAGAVAQQVEAAAVGVEQGQQRPGQGRADGKNQHRITQATGGHLGLPAGQVAGRVVFMTAGLGRLKHHVTTADYPARHDEQRRPVPAGARRRHGLAFRAAAHQVVHQRLPLLVRDGRAHVEQHRAQLGTVAGQHLHRCRPLLPDAGPFG